MDKRYLVGGVVCVLLLVIIVWMIKRRRKNEVTSAPVMVPVVPVVQPAPVVTVAPYVYDPNKMETRAPESKLLNFAFESLLRPGYVPTLDAKLAPMPSANPVYALVDCGVSGSRYAVRWQNKYLTVVTGDVLVWNDVKQEPNSCFVVVPGWCKTTGGDEYVMLRSAVNGFFLRADEGTGKLLCKDAPTTNTALHYCWKLRAPQLASDQSSANCGCVYDATVRGVVCRPCSVASAAAPASATPAPMPGPWPEMIGWDWRQAQAFLQQKYPGLAVYAVACAVDNTWCPSNITPTTSQAYVVLRYNPQTNRIIYAPAVEVPQAAAQHQQIVVNV